MDILAETIMIIKQKYKGFFVLNKKNNIFEH